jgi:hypothetical protein
MLIHDYINRRKSVSRPGRFDPEERVQGVGWASNWQEGYVIIVQGNKMERRQEEKSSSFIQYSA